MGLDGEACGAEAQRIERERVRLVHEIADGAEVDLRSDREAFRFADTIGRRPVIKPEYHRARRSWRPSAKKGPAHSTKNTREQVLEYQFVAVS
jgi:hypothetical protein